MTSSEERSKENKLADFGFKKVAEEEKADDVRQVFDSVAKKYDLMNDFLSFGLHRWWKRRTVATAAVAEGDKVLDIATGTCDLAIAFSRLTGTSGQVWGTDINRAMLEQGRRRVTQAGAHVSILQCDCEALPFPDGTFDRVCVSFGLRNMTHKDIALREMCRVTRPGGRVIVLEFSHCAWWLKPLYDFYSFVFMPWLGSKIVGDADSYRYLAESIRMHPNQEKLAEMMREAGMQASWKNLTFGICAIHVGDKPL